MRGSSCMDHRWIKPQNNMHKYTMHMVRIRMQDDLSTTEHDVNMMQTCDGKKDMTRIARQSKPKMKPTKRKTTWNR